MLQQLSNKTKLGTLFAPRRWRSSLHCTLCKKKKNSAQTKVLSSASLSSLWHISKVYFWSGVPLCANCHSRKYRQHSELNVCLTIRFHGSCTQGSWHGGTGSITQGPRQFYRYKPVRQKKKHPFRSVMHSCLFAEFSGRDSCGPHMWSSGKRWWFPTLSHCAWKARQFDVSWISYLLVFLDGGSQNQTTNKKEIPFNRSL